jgi:uncharacterized protein YxeA
MKKILLIVLAVLVAAGLVAFMVIKQQSGYTKVYTATLTREDLSTVISGTGQIKPKNYVNVGANAMGRITHLYVAEGDRVHKGEMVATIENVQQEANVNGQEAAIASAKTDIAAYIAAEKLLRQTSSTRKPTSNRNSWTGIAPRPSTKTESTPSSSTMPPRPPTILMSPTLRSPMRSSTKPGLTPIRRADACAPRKPI